MSIVSYAQNFEDVMLWRALGKVENGFYIDIGAQHPVIDSVSKAFYDRGWHGIHVEATPAYAALLKEGRPDENVLQAAVNDKSGSITFYEIPETGISTGDEEIARSHRARGFDVREITVPCVTLSGIFNQAKQAKAREIHWLKIDVEGMELQVLRSWGKHKARPWVVVVESTLPLTQTENHQAWESCLFDRGYTHVYFDGLNRYYLAPTHPELAVAFTSGPNVFDDFMLDGTASAPFCARVNEKYQQAEQALQAQAAQMQQHIDANAKVDAALAEMSQQLQSAKEEAARHVALESTLTAEISALQGQVQQSKDESAQREHAWQAQSAEALRHAQEQAQAHQTALQQREQALASQLEDLRAQMQQADQAAAQREQALKQLASETYRQAQEQAQAHLNALARNEQASEKQLEALQAEMRQARADAEQREQALQAQSASALQQAQDEAKAHLNTLAKRENAFAQQLQDLQAQMRQAAEQATQHEQALRAQSAGAVLEAQEKAQTHLNTLAAREQDFSGQIHELQAQMRQALEQADQRELALRNQSAAALEDARKKALEHLERLARREQAFSQQLQDLQAQMRDANHGASQREQALRELASETYRQAQTQAQAHLQALALHEQAFAKELQGRQTQLFKWQENAAVRERDLRQRSAEALRDANAQAQAHLHKLAQREQAFTQQLQDQQAQADQARETAAERTRELHRQSAESLGQAYAQVQTHLLALARREQAFGQELKELRQEMANSQSEASQREHSLRENAADAQQKADEQLAQRSENWAQREKELAKEITNLHVEAQALHHAQQLQKQEHEYQLTARREAQTRLTEKFVAFEAQLQSEMMRERQTSLLIRQSLAAAQQNLSSTQSSLAWRVSALLRMLAGLVCQPKASETPPVEALPHSPPPSFVASFSNITEEKLSQPTAAQYLVDTPKQAFPPAATTHPSVSAAAATNAQPNAATQNAQDPLKSPTTEAQPAPVAQAHMTPLQVHRPTQPIQASSLDELLACDDQHFVCRAYQTLLGRAPDPEGLGYSLGRLRQGIPKIQLLVQLRRSGEGEAHAANLPGLDRAIHRYQQEQNPMIGWIFKRLHGAETNHPIERKLRAIENKINLLSDQSMRRFDQLEVGLSKLHAFVSQQPQSFGAGIGIYNNTNASMEQSEPIHSEEVRQLSVRARDIYSQLRITAAAQMRGNAQ